MSRMWGPPGLETPTTVPGATRPFIAAAFGLAVLIGMPWCQNTFGSIDLDTGNRSCPTLPSDVKSWSVVGDMREPGEAETLQKWIVRNPRKVNKQYGAFCQTLLHLAAQWGREDLAEVLIAGGADVEARNESDERPLHVAARYGRPTVVKVLLAKNADVRSTGRRGNTPLHAAACGLGGQSDIAGRLEAARLLLAAGADVDAQEIGSRFTPLRCAMHYESRNATMAALLTSHGADLEGADERPIPGRPR